MRFGLALGVFSAAVFAQPAVAEIEEVVGLIHQKGCRVSGIRYRVSVPEPGAGLSGRKLKLKLEMWNLKPDT